MVRTETSYYLPAYWKAPWYRPRRARKLRKWRRDGFAAYQRKVQKLTGYAPVPEHLSYELHQGMAFAYVERVRNRGKMILTKPVISDAYLSQTFGG